MQLMFILRCFICVTREIQLKCAYCYYTDCLLYMEVLANASCILIGSLLLLQFIQLQLQIQKTELKKVFVQKLLSDKASG